MELAGGVDSGVFGWFGLLGWVWVGWGGLGRVGSFGLCMVLFSSTSAANREICAVLDLGSRRLDIALILQMIVAWVWGALGGYGNGIGGVKHDLCSEMDREGRLSRNIQRRQSHTPR